MSDFMSVYISDLSSSNRCQSHRSSGDTSGQPFFLSPTGLAAETPASLDQSWKGFGGLIAAFLSLELALGPEPGAGVPGELFVSPGCLSI